MILIFIGWLLYLLNTKTSLIKSKKLLVNFIAVDLILISFCPFLNYKKAIENTGKDAFALGITFFISVILINAILVLQVKLHKKINDSVQN